MYILSVLASIFKEKVKIVGVDLKDLVSIMLYWIYDNRSYWLGGTIAVVVAYLLVTTEKLSPESKVYQLLNLFGAIGIIINSGFHGAIPSVGLNVVWLLIAVYGLLEPALKKKKKR